LLQVRTSTKQYMLLFMKCNRTIHAPGSSLADVTEEPVLLFINGFYSKKIE